MSRTPPTYIYILQHSKFYYTLSPIINKYLLSLGKLYILSVKGTPVTIEGRERLIIMYIVRFVECVANV